MHNHRPVESRVVRPLRQLLRTPWLPVLLTALLCAGGSWWGYTEIWNADQMAFKDLFREGAWPFSPPHFDKPPLLTYINFVFSVAPRVVLVRVARASSRATSTGSRSTSSPYGSPSSCRRCSPAERCGCCGAS